MTSDGFDRAQAAVDPLLPVLILIGLLAMIIFAEIASQIPGG
jgi:hypothetical protein